MSLIDIKNVSLQYGPRSVVKDVSVAVEQGEFFVIIGPNGAGKTSLLKALSGLHPLTEGTVLIREKPIDSYSKKELARTLALVPQQINADFPFTVTATVLIYVFAIRLEWFPAITMVSSDVPVLELLPNIVLPIITLTLIMVAHILRLVRTNMIDVLTSDYIQMAKLKGVPYWSMVFKHALPNAMLPTINVVALTLAWLLGGVAIIETVFNYPGIGKLMIDAVGDRDLALVQGIAIILAIIYISLNLIADMLSMILNPKLRTARGH